MSENLKFYIEIFATFGQKLWVQGWVFSSQPIQSLQFVIPGEDGAQFPVPSYGQIPSPDVQRHFDLPDAHSVRFDEKFAVDLSNEQLNTAGLEILYSDGGRDWIDHLGLPRGQRSPLIYQAFLDMLRKQKPGTILEVGSRARSGITRRDSVPDSWRYVGMDVLEGPNVDVIGDAHELSALFPANTFDAVMALSVLEHLFMPWKFVIELNRVLKIGGIGIFTTHQCWPIHDQPWDFWRYSDKAWDSLLNRATGFSIIEARMDEPAFIVAQRCHPITNFGTAHSGFLSSIVLFKKVTNTALDWPVKLTDIITTRYPTITF
jgi:Methyltransferase domain